MSCGVLTGRRPGRRRWLRRPGRSSGRRSAARAAAHRSSIRPASGSASTSCGRAANSTCGQSAQSARGPPRQPARAGPPGCGGGGCREPTAPADQNCPKPLAAAISRTDPSRPTTSVGLRKPLNAPGPAGIRGSPQGFVRTSGTRSPPAGYCRFSRIRRAIAGTWAWDSSMGSTSTAAAFQCRRSPMAAADARRRQAHGTHRARRGRLPRPSAGCRLTPGNRPTFNRIPPPHSAASR